MIDTLGLGHQHELNLFIALCKFPFMSSFSSLPICFPPLFYCKHNSPRSWIINVYTIRFL